MERAIKRSLETEPDRKPWHTEGYLKLSHAMVYLAESVRGCKPDSKEYRSVVAAMGPLIQCGHAIRDEYRK